MLIPAKLEQKQPWPGGMLQRSYYYGLSPKVAGYRKRAGQGRSRTSQGWQTKSWQGRGRARSRLHVPSQIDGRRIDEID